MKIYQFTVELKYYKPRMWRRILVGDDTTVAELGYIVLSIFRASCSHLMSIEKPMYNSRMPQEIYEIPNPYEDALLDDSLDATVELVQDAVSLEKGDDTLVVVYDFGDNWEFKLKLEKILDAKDVKQSQIPCVVAGKGFGIIDDCGGTYGLEQIAEAIKLKSGDAYEQYCDWMDLDSVDLSYFDKDELNGLLEEEFEDIKNAYENPDYFE